jgi:ADP-ribose pyrophosphatase YjhB (NUDIX family)
MKLYYKINKIKYTGILLFKNNKLLLLKDKYTNEWMTPGGHIENNETPIQAMKREYFEETSYKLPKIYKLNSFIYNNHTQIFYAMTNDNIKFKPTNETSNFNLININKLNKIKLKSYVKKSYNQFIKTHPNYLK